MVEGLGVLVALLSLCLLEPDAAKRRDLRSPAHEHRRAGLCFTLSRAADMQPGGSREVLTRDVMLPRLARASTEAFAITTDEEINRIACARRAVGDMVLAKQAGRLHK